MDRLWVVPYLSSGIVERAKREHAWKSPHTRKGRRGGERGCSSSCSMVVTKSANKWSWSGDRGTGKKGNVSSRAFLINSDIPLPTLPLPRALPQCGHPCSREIRIQPLTPGPEDNSRCGSNLLAPKLQRKPHWNRQQNTKPVINTQFSEGTTSISRSAHLS